MSPSRSISKLSGRARSPSMAEYRLTSASQQDLDDIFEHSVAEWGLSVALRYTDDLDAAFVTLASAPQRGQSCETIRPGYRRLGVGSHMIYYKATGYGVAVTRILHQRMDALRHLLARAIAKLIDTPFSLRSIRNWNSPPSLQSAPIHVDAFSVVEATKGAMPAA